MNNSSNFQKKALIISLVVHLCIILGIWLISSAGSSESAHENVEQSQVSHQNKP